MVAHRNGQRAVDRRIVSMGEYTMESSPAIAQSILGKCLPSSLISEKDILIAMKAYLDGSGGNNTEFLVLAGVAADDAAWDRFDHGWNGVLADRIDPKPLYLHMHEVNALTEGFRKELGWTDDLAAKVATDCLMYAQTLDKQRFRTFLCSIDMKAYRALEAEGALLPDCYDLCVYFSPVRILKWYMSRLNEATPRPELHYYFDAKERFKGRFEKRWIRGKKSSGRLLNQWHMVKTVATRDMNDTPGIQLADVLAWACHRRLMAERFPKMTKYKHFAHFIEQVLPFDRKEIGGEDLRLIAYYGEQFPSVLHDRGFVQ
jgi:hypothetical protein